MKENVCSRCEFWDNEKEDFVLSGDKSIFFGKCKKLSPRLVHKSEEAIFPRTSQNDWCGKFRIRYDLRTNF